MSHNNTAPYIMPFFYKPFNDFQIYCISCREITLSEFIQLFNDWSYSYFHSNDLFVFYFQHPYDKGIYQITCEMVPHSMIVQFLNLNIYGNELNQSIQHPLEFTNRHKENLEVHLKQFLIDYLPPKEIYNQLNTIDERMNSSETSLVSTSDNNLCQNSISQQDNNNQSVDQGDSENYVQNYDNNL